MRGIGRNVGCCKRDYRSRRTKTLFSHLIDDCRCLLPSQCSRNTWHGATLIMLVVGRFVMWPRHIWLPMKSHHPPIRLILCASPIGRWLQCTGMKRIHFYVMTSRLHVRMRPYLKRFFTRYCSIRSSCSIQNIYSSLLLVAGLCPSESILRTKPSPTPLLSPPRVSGRRWRCVGVTEMHSSKIIFLHSTCKLRQWNVWAGEAFRMRLKSRYSSAAKVGREA